MKAFVSILFPSARETHLMRLCPFVPGPTRVWSEATHGKQARRRHNHDVFFILFRFFCPVGLFAARASINRFTRIGRIRCCCYC